MYSIGLDLGISSVGWSVIDERTGNVIDLGVRLIRRKTNRLKDAKKYLRLLDFMKINH